MVKLGKAVASGGLCVLLGTMLLATTIFHGPDDTVFALMLCWTAVSSMALMAIGVAMIMAEVNEPVATVKGE